MQTITHPSGLDFVPEIDPDSIGFELVEYRTFDDPREIWRAARDMGASKVRAFRAGNGRWVGKLYFTDWIPAYDGQVSVCGRVRYVER